MAYLRLQRKIKMKIYFFLAGALEKLIQSDDISENNKSAVIPQTNDFLL